MKIKMLKICSLLLTMVIVSGCAKEKEDKSTTNLLVLAALGNRSSSSSTREMYTGFADIPASIYKTVASGSASSSIQTDTRTLATTDYKFVNSDKTGSVSGIYDLVRGTAKTTRDIAKTIGDIVKALESIPVTTTLQGSDKWANIPAKYKYQTSTVLTGGKKLEVWWDNGVATASAPYGTNKAIDINYTGSSTAGNLSGFVFARFLSATTATTLSKAYIKFDYSTTTNTRTMVVIMQDIGPTYTDRAHFFVQEVNGVTSMDGAYTINNFDTKATGVTASSRVYVFSAVGDSTKAAVNAALPLSTDSTSAIYANTAMGNIGQVWTNFIFANSAVVTAVQGVGGSCASPNVILTPTSGNPTGGTATGVTTVAALKTCLDAIVAAQNSTNSVKDVYFLTNIKNPAYFTVTGNAVNLYGVESLEATDTNKAAFDTLSAKLLTSTRTTANTTYAAVMDAATVSSLNLFTGVGIQTGISATSLTNLNVQWGNGTPGTGISSASAGTNTVNGSTDNIAPF